MPRMSNKQIVNRVRAIRTKNNRLWMDLLLLAFKNDPKSAKRVIQQIREYDKSVVRYMGKLH